MSTIKLRVETQDGDVFRIVHEESNNVLYSGSGEGVQHWMEHQEGGPYAIRVTVEGRPPIDPVTDPDWYKDGKEVGSPPRRRIKTEDINAKNKEFWKAENENLDKLLKYHPQLVAEAAALAARVVAAGGISNPAVAQDTGMQLPNADELRKQEFSRVQSRHAGKPRPKRGSSLHRSLVIAAMRNVRAGGGTLPDFLEQHSDNDSLSVKLTPLRGAMRYVVKSERLLDDKSRWIEKKVAKSTLDGWWRAARLTKRS